MIMGIIEKINRLTSDELAKEYFSQNGLNNKDIEEITEVLVDKLQNKEIMIRDIKKELQILINQYPFKSGSAKTQKNKINKKSNEKILTFRLNNDFLGFICENCNSKVLSDFNFCPYCGCKLTLKDLTLIGDNTVNLKKGYVTPNELNHIKLVTPSELKIIESDKSNIDKIGIKVTENNSPLEIRTELLYKNPELKDDYNARKILFIQNLKNSKKIVHIDTFDQKNPQLTTTYPIDKSKIPKQDSSNNIQPSNVIEHRKLKRHILNVPIEKQTKTDKSEQSKEQIDIELEYAGVLYLLNTIRQPKNPNLSKSMLNFLNVSSNRKIINFLRKNNYLLDAEESDIIRINLQQKKVSDLKKILSANKLQVSGTKDDLITRICENIPFENLSKYSKGKAFKITEDGQSFVDCYPQVEMYAMYLKQYDLDKYEKIYEENSNSSMKDIVLLFLKEIRKEFVEQLKWSQFSDTYQTEIKLYRDFQDNINELVSCINFFICSINPWIDNGIRWDNIKPVTQTVQNEIIKLMNNCGFNEEDAQNIIIQKIEEIELPYIFIKATDTFNYFMRISGEENLDVINKEIQAQFDINQLKNVDLTFKSKEEQNEKVEEIKRYFK